MFLFLQKNRLSYNNFNIEYRINNFYIHLNNFLVVYYYCLDR